MDESSSIVGHTLEAFTWARHNPTKPTPEPIYFKFFKSAQRLEQMKANLNAINEMTKKL